MRYLLLAALAVMPAWSQKTYVTLDTNTTKVNFTLGDVLHVVHGTFRLTRGDFWFDSSSSTAGGLLVVNAASGNSGSHARDSRMNKNILQSEQYPEITFAPDRIEGKASASGHSDFGLNGMFSLHGSPHELTMRVKSDIQSDRLSATANFDVPYVKWGLKNPSTLLLRVNETVQIEINAIGGIAATPAQTAAQRF